MIADRGVLVEEGRESQQGDGTAAPRRAARRGEGLCHPVCSEMCQHLPGRAAVAETG